MWYILYDWLLKLTWSTKTYLSVKTQVMARGSCLTIGSLITCFLGIGDVNSSGGLYLKTWRGFFILKESILLSPPSLFTPAPRVEAREWWYAAWVTTLGLSANDFCQFNNSLFGGRNSFQIIIYWQYLAYNHNLYKSLFSSLIGSSVITFQHN